MNPLTAEDLPMHPSDLVHVLCLTQSHVNSSSLQGQPNSSDLSVQSSHPSHLTENLCNRMNKQIS